MTKQQFIKIAEWQQKTFGKATALSKINHLQEEVQELKEELQSQFSQEQIRKEFADCFILLFGAANSHGMNYEQIVDCINEKMEINYSRKWGEPGENGVVNHIKEDESSFCADFDMKLIDKPCSVQCPYCKSI